MEKYRKKSHCDKIGNEEDINNNFGRRNTLGEANILRTEVKWA